MIESIVTCDRCGKKCEGNTYYTVDICEHDITPTNDFRTYFDTAHSIKRHYCKDCKKDLEKFLKRDK